MLSLLESRHIAEESLSLQERLRRISHLDKEGVDRPSKTSIARRAKWLELAFNGSNISFQKRLAVAGLDDDDINLALTENLGCLDEIPKWLGTLSELLDAIRRFDSDIISDDNLSRWPYLTPDNPVPFEEIFVPIVEFSKIKLIRKLSREAHLFADSAYVDLDRFLLVRLAESCSRILELEFNSYLALTQLEGVEYRAIRNNSGSRTYYRQFVSGLLNDGLKRLCCDYPVFARHLVHCIEQWVNTTAEQQRRLFDDEADLVEVFGLSKGAQVIHVFPGLSDTHDKGRTVALVEFDTGHKIIYKPKDVSADVGYFALVRWLNQSGAPHDFKMLKLVDRSHYGWMEFAENMPMDSDSQASGFYLRCGALLALFYMLDSVDFHHENIVAMGEYPIPIDCETIAQHRAVSIKKGERVALELIERSVLRSHFLPKATKIRGNYVDVSGMGASGKKKTQIDILKHSNINTDAMAYQATTISRSFDSANAPQLGNRALLPEDYIEEVVRGFEQTYHFISQIRDQMLDIDSPFIRLLQQSVRYFKHSTELYGSILSRISHPKFQKSGIDLGIELEVLYRDVFTENGAEPLWSLVDLEIEDLFHHDLPKFMAKADQNTMTAANGLTIDSCFDSTPLQDARKKLNNLSDSDLEWQKKLIRDSIRGGSKFHLDRELNDPIDGKCEYSHAAFDQIESRNKVEAISEAELRAAMPEIFQRSQVSDEFRMICLKDPRQAVFIVTGKMLPQEAGLTFVDE